MNISRTRGLSLCYWNPCNQSVSSNYQGVGGFLTGELEPVQGFLAAKKGVFLNKLNSWRSFVLLHGFVLSLLVILCWNWGLRTHAIQQFAWVVPLPLWRNLRQGFTVRGNWWGFISGDVVDDPWSNGLPPFEYSRVIFFSCYSNFWLCCIEYLNSKALELLSLLILVLWFTHYLYL